MSVQAAIAGAGLMGHWHARSIVRHGGTIAAVYDPDVSAAAKLAARFGGARTCGTPEEIFAAGSVDVLHVCAPLEHHFPLAAAALEHGVNVLVEKPLTPSVAETAELFRLAEVHSRLVCPVHQFAFQRGVVKALATRSQLGRLLHFEALFCSAGAVGGKSRPDEVVADILPHPLSLMERFAPACLSDDEWQITRPTKGELRAARVHDEGTYSLTISMNGRPTCCSLTLIFSEGTVRIDLFHGFAVIEPGNLSRWRKIAHPFDLAARSTIGATFNLAQRALSGESAYPGLRTLIGEFYDAVATGGSSPITPGEVLRIAHARDFIIGSP